MGALDGFYSTWSKAKDTFGVGTPTDGSQYDGSSSQLLNMKSRIESAAPDDRWQGSGSQAYAAANKEHAGVYQKLADLDRKMAAEVTNAANVVTNGRNQLDTTKSWVDSAVDSLPKSLSSAAREKSLIPIAHQGITQVNNTVQNANKDMNTIAGRFTSLRGEFDALTNQKFAPGEKNGDAEDKDGDGKPDEDDVGTKAEHDVHDTLAGDKEAAARVEKVLGTIKPYQELTPEQAAYLNEMQDQQAGMSVKDLKTAEERLGDKGDVIGDSWQLMSNDDVPRSAGNFDEQQKGGFDRLPQSVQDAIKSPGLESTEELRDITSIVKDGNPNLQTGTEIDRELMRKADRMMDDRLWDGDLTATDDPAKLGRDPHFDPIVRDIFDSAGRDHTIVRDHLTGIKGDDGQDFMQDINKHAWGDMGKSAGSLFDWTEGASRGPEAQIAAETAEAYGTYIGDHSNDLMHLPGNNTLGELNPELARSYAHGLGDYIPDIADLSTADQKDAFGNPDLGDPNKTTSKGIFTVLSTDKDASDWFNGKATAAAVAAQTEYANAFKSGEPNLETYNDKLLDAATLQALVDCGTVNAANATDLNDYEKAMLAYERQSSAYDFGVESASKIAGFVPRVGDVISQGIDEIAPALKDNFVGPEPELDAKAPTVSNIGYGGAAQIALNPLIAAGFAPAGLPNDYLVPIDPERPDGPLRIGTPAEIAKWNGVSVSENKWSNDLNNAATYTVGAVANPVDDIAQRYEDLTKVPNP